MSTNTMLEVHPKLLPVLSANVKIRLTNLDAVVSVDGQNDFADPHGALYVAGAEEILESGANFLERFSEDGRIVTGCWHDSNHRSFKEFGGTWPAHCVKFTWGAEQHPKLNRVTYRMLIRKGVDDSVESYGAAYDANGESNGLVEYLIEQDKHRVFVFMLAFDFCVGETAFQLAHKGFEVYVVADLTKAIGIDVEGGNSIDVMIARLQSVGVKFIISDQVQ